MQTLVQTGTVLVAEDEPEVRNYLEMALRCQGYRVECAQDGDEVLACLQDNNRDISVVLLDIMMPRKDGMETLREIRRLDHELPIIMLSGASSPLKVVEAIKNGATDFLGKPVSHDELGHAIRKALEIRHVVFADFPETAAPGGVEQAFPSRNPRMKKIQRALHQIGASDVPVLLQGESGVGKEILARQLHEQSPRSSKPFMKINCAALPSELLESELFGYERGAFTGAFKNKPGKFELADGGTILLDEIGDMDFKLQAKLLQVLQDHEFQRLGGKETVSVDVRVLAATHCDLETAMRDGRFREDLYYRLNVISIHVPALRERRDEIAPLATFFLKKHALPGATIPPISAPLKQALLSHDWPGNIRELENVMRKFLVFRDPDMVAEELKFKTRRKALTPPAPGLPATAESPAVEELAPPVPNPAPPLPSAAAAEPVSEVWPDLAPPEELEVSLADGNAHSSPAERIAGEPESAGALLEVHAAPNTADAPAQRAMESPASILLRVEENRRHAETQAILAALNARHWNRKQAAALLQMDYKALLYKMKKLAIADQPPFREAPPAGLLQALPPDPQTPLLQQVERARRQAEAEAILAVLQATRWNRKQAAKLLNLDYKALLYKMKKLSLGVQPAQDSC